MNTARFLFVAALTFWSCSSAATLLNYSYQFEGQFTTGGDGNFTIDTEARTLNRLTFNDYDLGISFTWMGSSPFREFDSSNPWLGTIEGGFETITQGPYELWTIFWLPLIPPEDDPFENLHLHERQEDFWLLVDNSTGDRHGLIFTVSPPVVVPEPATLSLLALGLAAIGIRRRLRAVSPCSRSA